MQQKCLDQKTIYSVDCVGKQIIKNVVASTLPHAQDWDMLKPPKMGSGEMEGRKSDCVEWPNEGRMKGRAAGTVSCQYIACKSHFSIFPAAGSHGN